VEIIKERRKIMEQKVTVTIDKDGKVRIDVDGVQGSSCKDITGAVTKALGGTVVSSTDKPEMYYELDGIKQNVYGG